MKDYELAVDVVRAAGSDPEAVIAALVDEGWLIDPPRCEHKDGDNAYDCEIAVAPGEDVCGWHK